jgi:hypothetical protein
MDRRFRGSIAVQQSSLDPTDLVALRYRVFWVEDPILFWIIRIACERQHDLGLVVGHVDLDLLGWTGMMSWKIVD